MRCATMLASGIRLKAALRASAWVVLASITVALSYKPAECPERGSNR